MEPIQLYNAIRAALAIMDDQQVHSWNEVSSDDIDPGVLARLTKYELYISLLRLPTLIPGTRRRDAGISIAICQKCGGWWTVPIKRLAKSDYMYGIPSSELSKLKCVVTSRCDGRIRVPMVSAPESVTTTRDLRENKENDD